MYFNCVVQLDSGAQVNFISQSCIDRLILSPTKMSLPIIGIGSTHAKANYVINTTLLSKMSSSFQFDIDLHVLPIITNVLPSQHVDIDQFVIPGLDKLNLANPSYGVPSVVDIVLGAYLFYTLIGEERIQMSSQATFHNTQLG